MIAMPHTVHGTGRRHRIVAIGSGFSGLTATKALKHAQVNIIDTLVFLTRITVQGTSHIANQTLWLQVMPAWLQVMPAPAVVSITIGVLIAMYVAVSREPRKLMKNTGIIKHRCSHSTRPKGNVLRLDLEKLCSRG